LRISGQDAAGRADVPPIEETESRKAKDLSKSSQAGSIWFHGDWSDPWLRGLADGLPCAKEILRLDLSGSLPADRDPPDVLVLHRNRLIARDAERLANWKRESTWHAFPSTILCHGPFARYAELERWLPLVEIAIPEATCVDTLPRHLDRCSGNERDESIRFRDESIRVVIVSTNGDLRRTLCDLCAEWIPNLVELPDIDAKSSLTALDPGTTISLIDVPLLEPSWESKIAWASRWGGVIALLGFADRAVVETARRHGARACLELPFDRDDLVYLLDRCFREPSATPWESGRGGFDPGHTLPRPPTSARMVRTRSVSNRKS
jgi:hypothetical protein